MKSFPKEIIIAIVLGFGIGLMITYGIRQANQAIKNKERTISPVTEISEINPSTSPQEIGSSSNTSTALTIITPEIQTYTDQETYMITGTTMANTPVIVYDEESTNVVISDNNGDFEHQVTLIKGANFLEFVVFDKNQEPITENRTIIYSTADF